MAQLIEPLRQDRKMDSILTEIFNTPDPYKKNSVAIVFWHGLGDCIQFKGLLEFLRKRYSDLQIDILIQNNLGQKTIFPDGIELNDASDEFLKSMDYDAVFKIHFPVEVPGKTKSELCCETELGIDPTTIYVPLPVQPSRLIGVHMFNTALPGVFNVTENVAQRIWSEIQSAGFIPIETAFKHIYHNPGNAKFDFVDATVRGVSPTVEALISLMGSCRAFMGVPSGPLHCAIAMRKPILFLKRAVTIDQFVRDPIDSIDVDNYQDGCVFDWLKKLGAPVSSYVSYEHVEPNAPVGSAFGV